MISDKPARLCSDLDRTPSLHCLQCLQKSWNERQVILQAIGVSHDHHDGDFVLGKILLMSKILICGDKDIKPAAGELEKFTVVLGLPALITYGSRLVLFEMIHEATRN